MPIAMRSRAVQQIFDKAPTLNKPTLKPERLSIAIKHTTPLGYRRAGGPPWSFLWGVILGSVVTGLLAIVVLP
jgi:hypothetical protein